MQQEGYLFRSCLSEGLTALRNANIHDIGQYYIAFFQLSIGLERLMKVIIILEYAATHDLTFPTTALLRGLGHDLHELVAGVQRIQASWPSHPLSFLISSTIEWEILDHLNEFAKGARYFNLDRITAHTSRVDPLRRWKFILERIIATEHSVHEPGIAAAQSTIMCAASQCLNPLSSQEEQVRAWQQYFENGQMYEQGAGYATYRVLRILDGLREVLYEVTSAAHAMANCMGIKDACVPFMTEFLSFVDAEDCQRVIDKKCWP